MLRIVSQAGSVERFLEIYSRFYDRAGLYIATEAPRDVGTSHRFAITLASGEALMHGECKVVEAYSSADNRHGMAGMKLRLDKLDEPGRRVLQALASRREPSPATGRADPGGVVRSRAAYADTDEVPLVHSGRAADPREQVLRRQAICRVHDDPTGDHPVAGGGARGAAVAAGREGTAADAVAGETRGRPVHQSDFGSDFDDEPSVVIEPFAVAPASRRSSSGPEPALPGLPAPADHPAAVAGAASQPGSTELPPGAATAIAAPPDGADRSGPARVPIPAEAHGAPSLPGAWPPATPPGPVQRVAVARAALSGPASSPPAGAPSPASPQDSQPRDVPSARPPNATPTPLPRTPSAPSRRQAQMPTATPIPVMAATPHPALGKASERSPGDDIQTELLPALRAGWSWRLPALAASIAVLAGLGGGYLLWGRQAPPAPAAAVAPIRAESMGAEVEIAPRLSAGSATRRAREDSDTPSRIKSGRGAAGAAEQRQDEAAPSQPDRDGDAAAGARTQAPAARGAMCRVRIASSPRGAAVYAGQRKLGIAPLGVRLPCGDASLRFERKRYQTVDKLVALTPDRRNNIFVKLERPEVQLNVTSAPPGAAVVVDGKQAGETPLSIAVSGFTWTQVIITKAGYRAQRRRLYPRAARVDLQVKLRRR